MSRRTFCGLSYSSARWVPTPRARNIIVVRKSTLGMSSVADCVSDRAISNLAWVSWIRSLCGARKFIN
eukprot:7425033-Pyramimonas_sp.AAC.1